MGDQGFVTLGVWGHIWLLQGIHVGMGNWGLLEGIRKGCHWHVLVVAFVAVPVLLQQTERSYAKGGGLQAIQKAVVDTTHACQYVPQHL